MSKKEDNPKEENKATVVQDSIESLDSENDFFSAQEFLDDLSDSIRKSVKFENSESLLEIIEVEREEDGSGDESGKTRPIILDFIPRTSVLLFDDQELIAKAAPEAGILETKSEYQIEDQTQIPLKSESSVEAYQFLKRSSKFGEVGNALVTDAFVSSLTSSNYIFLDLY